ncbi:hypothetical protein BKA69DRAFT_1042257 [Paraphysoderma sedebokerense]|nr:hypothetical protein BKA69DRAFT_1042257 [Paraphysoderma sedebokerense]
MSDTGATPPLSFIITTYVFAISAVVFFSALAVIMTRRYLKSRDFSLEEFITARGTQKSQRIAWSFFASAMGAWAIAAPSQIAVYNGYLGLISYSISAGIPIMVVVFLGVRIQRKLPHALSLSDFGLWRYGRPMQFFITALVTFNMCIALLSEYSVIGSIYKDFVGSSQYAIIIIVGVFTLAYSAYGGLLISIITDQFQGIMASLLVIILAIYTAATFRPTLGPLPEYLGASNTLGQQSLFSLPISMIAATVFSETYWQRVWASEDKQQLKVGASIGAILIAIAVFFFGFLGFLASWAGLLATDQEGNIIENYNLFLFQIFGSSRYSFIGVVTVLLTTVMNQGAVDSFQNALIANLASNFFRNRSANLCRIFVVVLNIPIMILGFFGLPALNLFLIGNILSTSCFIPVISGVFDPQRRWVSGYSVMFSCIMAIISVSVFGIIKQDGQFSAGMDWAWWSNGYDAFVFLTAMVSSIIWQMAWITAAKVMEKCFGIQGQEVTEEMRSVLKETGNE